MTTGDINDVIDAQISNQGVGVVSVKDGTTLVFTTACLERLLAQSRAEGRVIVLVRHQRPA